MEILQLHTVRRAQFTDAHEKTLTANNALKSNFDRLKIEMIEYKTKAHYWEAQFTQIKTREEKLKVEIVELKAKLKKREQQLFGKKAETHAVSDDEKISHHPQLQKKRGQQTGSKGHGNRSYNHLPVIHEQLSLAEDKTCCPCCGNAYEELTATEDSSVLDVINVKVYRRFIRRKNIDEIARVFQILPLKLSQRRHVHQMF